MPDNLNDLVEKNRKSNERVLRRGKLRHDNQRSRESDLRRRVKKGFVYGSLISALALGAYGGHHYYNEYQSYIAEQNNKMAYYQKKFNTVRYYYNKKSYMKADELSEKLQGELDEEWFFSPTNELYKKVKEYDDKFIDPQVRRIKRERLKKMISEIPYKLKEKWDNAGPEGKALTFIGSCVVFAIIWKILSGKKEETEDE